MALTKTPQFSSPLRIFTLLAVIHFVQSARYYEHLDYGISSRHCYSCMSEEFLEHWPHLNEIYHQPLNFTNYCYKITPNIHIGIVQCNTMCVTVVEPRILAGMHVGNNIIRGCLSSVFKHELVPRLQESIFVDTSCTRLPANRLLPTHLSRRSSNRTVELCLCTGHLCNDYPRVAMNTMAQVSSIFPILAAVLIHLVND